ncbi:hypothetical protein [Halosolutus gelatinilyticus]|uniref:hypothetical protein n=1 Tax=Halosolutus gelatinilyticus TaxID=2931975 RepID=UPI001FF6A8F3|nr:hypothetical protein [Halosolutus gelatinilyticus]
MSGSQQLGWTAVIQIRTVVPFVVALGVTILGVILYVELVALLLDVLPTLLG